MPNLINNQHIVVFCLYMSEKCTTFVGGMRISIAHIFSQACRMVCVVGLVCSAMCGLSSCGWHEAKGVIAVADSLDQTEHVIYDDTTALGGVIRCLDNPVGRLLMSNTLGKAYYFMGRNYSLSDQIVEAAECYIEADRLQIDDPIYHGRVNSCMGYICAQNNNDSLALIFYERSNNAFKESGNEWYYAQMLLDCSECHINLHKYCVADSFLQIAQSYQLDNSYQARYYETWGLYFYEQQQYDSALVYFERGLNYWQSEEEKCFSYLKVMQAYYLSKISIDSVVHYANKLIRTSNNPNYISNAYYCLMQDAKNKDNVELLSQYSHARTDAQKLLRAAMVEDAQATPLLEEYLKNPFPMRWIRIVLFVFVALCIVLLLVLFAYRKYTITRIHVSDAQIVSLSAQVREHQDKLQEQSKRHYYEKHLNKIRRKYPKPLNRWNEYAELKKDIQPYLHNWFLALEELNLTNREKVFCAVSFIYPQMATEDISNYLCITKEALLVRKNRLAKKLGITSVELGVFLQKLANNE